MNIYNEISENDSIAILCLHIRVPKFASLAMIEAKSYQKYSDARKSLQHRP